MTAVPTTTKADLTGAGSQFLCVDAPPYFEHSHHRHYRKTDRDLVVPE